MVNFPNEPIDHSNETAKIGEQPLQAATSSTAVVSAVAHHTLRVQAETEQPEPKRAQRFHEIKWTVRTAPFEVKYYYFYRHLATLISHGLVNFVGHETRKTIEFMILHGQSKAASFTPSHAEVSELQISPLYPKGAEYHRSVDSSWFKKVHEAVAKKLGLTSQEILLINSPLAVEVIRRHYPNNELATPQTFDEFTVLFDAYVKGLQHDPFDAPGAPDQLILFDHSALLNSDQCSLELAKINQFLELKDVPLGIIIYAVINIDELPVLIIPTCRNVPKVDAERMEIFQLINKCGFKPSPEHAKRAWLDAQPLFTILREAGIVPVVLDPTKTRSLTLPPNLRLFLTGGEVKAFRELSNEQGAAPYLQIMPEAIFQLLEGLAETGEIERLFKENNLTSLLQVFVTHLRGAMKNAVSSKNDLLAFCTQLECIHQIIQDILALAPIHDETVLEKCITARLNPILPAGLGPPQVHLKASGMRCLASVCAAVEALKGSPALCVVQMKDIYYESAAIVDAAPSYENVILDGDTFNAQGIEAALKGGVSQPVDLFICEFHHNVSVNRSSYTSENITEQVKAMHYKGYLAEPCTLLIDTTINLELSDDFQVLFNDPVIKQLIEKGKLNVVLFRSAQKFDMLGADNYYGGIAISVNRRDNFAPFRERMNRPEDQLRGLNYQGIAHLHKYAGEQIDRYRKAIMKNTHLLYDLLPAKCKYVPGTTNPIQISAIQDEMACFLDIKFRMGSLGEDVERELAKVFAHLISTVIGGKHIGLTARPSFGFTNINYASFGRLFYRLTPGLENTKTLEKIANLFEEWQQVVDSLENEASQKGLARNALYSQLPQKLKERNEKLLYQWAAEQKKLA